MRLPAALLVWMGNHVVPKWVQIIPAGLSLYASGLHPLKGNRKGAWAVKVSGNWRVTFMFVGKDADTVDYEDYH